MLVEIFQSQTNLVSYNRFMELMSRVLLPLCCYLHGRKGEGTGISFVDSTRITVCGNKRISRNQVFKEVAELGKSSMGWFFGVKLHVVVNDQGELLAFIRKNMRYLDPHS
jgi:Transposase DDE domain